MTDARMVRVSRAVFAVVALMLMAGVTCTVVGTEGLGRASWPGALILGALLHGNRQWLRPRSSFCTKPWRGLRRRSWWGVSVACLLVAASCWLLGVLA